uniref:Uncharacterized protein n=1 Tax=Caenorhabditis tropicalis TaxID=1561998 RepID=A0A1I7UNE2_9PELO
MKSLLVILFLVLAVANAQWGFNGGVPVGMGGMGIIGGGGPNGGIGPYGNGLGGGGEGNGKGWGRRRMMSGMMNPYMGMMYGRR